MSVSTILLLAVIFLAAASLWFVARSEHGAAMRQRAGLFDEAARHWPEARISHAEDGFPVLHGRIEDLRRWKAEIVADSLVPRRLPQLWLKLTVYEVDIARRPTLGVLVRPTGTEFYSLVQGFPDRLEPPFESPVPILMRGRRVARRDLERTSVALRSLLADPALKEAAVTPRGARIVRRLAEGGRGAHIMFRQMRFPIESATPAMVLETLADAEQLLEASDEPSSAVARTRELAYQ